MLLTLAVAYQEWKLVLVDGSGLARDALHIHVGLAAFVVARLVWRWRGGWAVAWLAALAFALGGEWFDMTVEGQAGVPQPDAQHWHDIWNTMLWPSVLAVVGRWLEPRRTTPPSPPATASGEDGEQPFEQA